jgi:hypothetical protein
MESAGGIYRGAAGFKVHAPSSKSTGGFSTENTKPIEDLVGRAPITTKQFVEDFKSAFS